MTAITECPLCNSDRVVITGIRGAVVVACRDCLALVKVEQPHATEAAAPLVVMLPPISKQTAH